MMQQVLEAFDAEPPCGDSGKERLGVSDDDTRVETADGR